MSLWSPTHVQFTVLRARNLIAKGKGGNNDVFVTIQLGKEKYQTSTIKNAVNPEWFEECDLPIPHMRSEIEMCAFHRGVLSDDFLGYASVPIWEHKITESAKSSWVSLQQRPNKPGDAKYRGELEVKLTFHCQSRPDMLSHGLKKRSSSIRNLASAFGNRFNFTRSRSFRDNRCDPERGKKRSLLARDSNNVTHDGQELGAYPHFHTNPSVHFSALDISRAPWGIDPSTPDALTRSYSMSAAYIKSLSLDRSRVSNYADNPNNHHVGSIHFVSNTAPEQGVSHIHSQSMYNLPGNRRSCAEVSFHQPTPLPYDIRLSSQDDSVLMASRDCRVRSDYHSSSALPLSTSSSQFEPVSHRDRPGIYESIKERTEPENSASSDSDPESVPIPKPRGKRFSRQKISVLASTGTKDSVSATRSDHQSFNGRDSGILEDRSSSLGNSLEGSLAATDGTNNGSKHRVAAPPSDCQIDQSRTDAAQGPGSLLYHLDREIAVNSSACFKSKSSVLSQFYSKENSQGELVVRKRSRGQRDRLRQMRQGSRRCTVPGLGNNAAVPYEDSTSEPSDSSRTDVPEDLVSVFKNMTKEDLLRVLITTKAQMIRKDQYIRDLETYIDDLLVRVMETTPRLLNQPAHHRL